MDYRDILSGNASSDVFLADDIAGAGGFEAHRGVSGIGALMDDFGGGVAVGGPVDLGSVS